VLARHAQATSGHPDDDPPLGDLGRRQAAALARALEAEEFDRVITSPLRRAAETARAFRPDGELETDARLREFDFGPQAPAMHQMADERADLQLWRHGDGFPDGETLGAFEGRVRPLLEELGSGDARSVLLFTHSGVILAALRWAWDLAVEAPWQTETEGGNASLTEIVHWPRGQHVEGAPRMTVIHRMADVSHLPAELRSDI
jgi:probable phosphoglycerate mutase